MERRDQRLHVRPTGAGLLVLAAIVLLAVVALLTGNNLLYMVEAVLLSAGLLAVVLGAWNLRGVEVARVLPVEFFASFESRGRFLLRNRRRWMPAISMELIELDGGGAWGQVAAVRPGGEQSASVGWRFAERGEVGIARVRIRSAFPFGLAIRWRDTILPASVLVYPRPLGGGAYIEPGGEGHEGGESVRGGALGDFLGLREYHPGDPIRSIHWPTTARVGEPHVVVRSTEAAERLLVQVREDQPWEEEIGRATGEVLRGFARDAEVGLHLLGTRYEPRPGGRWRRLLLDELARAPGRRGR